MYRQHYGLTTSSNCSLSESETKHTDDAVHCFILPSDGAAA